MTVALAEEHLELARSARKFLEANAARGTARALLEEERESLAPFWEQLVGLGWLGLHVPEACGGSGYGLLETAIVIAELGRAVAPGPYLPTVVASAVLARCGSPEQQAESLPGLAGGSVRAGYGVGACAWQAGDRVAGDAIVLGAGFADRLLVAVDDDLVLIDAGAEGVALDTPRNLDPTRRCGRARLSGVAVRETEVLRGARRAGVAIARVLFAAEAAGGAAACVDGAVEYAKVRQQFGRVIGAFQAVKHHCANMFVQSELAAAAVWHAAKVADDPGQDVALAGAMAATVALPAFTHNAQLHMQILGGIGVTWEHDAHLWHRRALALAALGDPDGAAEDMSRLEAAGARLALAVDLPPEAAEIRERVRADAAELAAVPADARRQALVSTGYFMPHWPKPWGREASPVELLVIDEEFDAAGIERPPVAITWWILLTLIQHGTGEQVARWVEPALAGALRWCQLFSEPDAGSDAAAIRTRAERTEDGWLVNGSKVWTSEAHLCQRGLATVRTDPDAAKHAGITMMVIDMAAPGVEVRPLRHLSGDSSFNEVFLTDVFVPDDDVVGALNDGWTVARSTLGNERVSIGGGVSQWGSEVDVLDLFVRRDGDRRGFARSIGSFLAVDHVLEVLNLRAVQRAVAGQGAGPEGNITKLALAEHGHERAALARALVGTDALFADGPLAGTVRWMITHRSHSIAGGTSEIVRNQIGERMLGLPRDR